MSQSKVHREGIEFDGKNFEEGKNLHLVIMDESA